MPWGSQRPNVLQVIDSTTHASGSQDGGRKDGGPPLGGGSLFNRCVVVYTRFLVSFGGYSVLIEECMVYAKWGDAPKGTSPDLG